MACLNVVYHLTFVHVSQSLQGEFLSCFLSSFSYLTSRNLMSLAAVICDDRACFLVMPSLAVVAITNKTRHVLLYRWGKWKQSRGNSCCRFSTLWPSYNLTYTYILQNVSWLRFPISWDWKTFFPLSLKKMELFVFSPEYIRDTFCSSYIWVYWYMYSWFSLWCSCCCWFWLLFMFFRWQDFHFKGVNGLPALFRPSIRTS